MKTMNPIIAGFVLALLSTGAQGTEISDTLSFLVGHEVVDPASGKKYMHVPAYVGPPIFGCSNFDAAQTMRRINLQNRPTFSTYEYAAMINKSGTDFCVVLNQPGVEWQVVDKVQTSDISKNYAYFCLAAPSNKEKPCVWVFLKDKPREARP